MSYRDSDESNFSRNHMGGNDPDDMRFGERFNPRGYGGEDQGNYAETGRRQDFEKNNDRYNTEQRANQDGMNRGRGNDPYRSRPQGSGGQSNVEGRSLYGPRGGYGYEQQNRQQSQSWGNPYENQGFRDNDRYASFSRNDEYDQSNSGNAYGFVRHNQGSQGHRDPDYQQWRDEQVRMLDDDYGNWRKERYQKFANDFTEWRSNRTSSESNKQSGQKGAGGSSTTGTASGSQGTTNKSKE